MPLKGTLLALPIAALLFACSSDQGNGNAAGTGSSSGVTGAGSTFVYPVLSAWAADYKKQGGPDINYQSIGSGGGIAQVKAGTVDFGATDQPLASDDLAKSKLAQFPIVIGGIVPVVNIADMPPGKLRLTGPVLADIFAARVKNWNDPEITKLNPGLNLPAAAIAVVHRSDASGTTFNFTHYLSQVSPAWKSGPGEGKSVKWPTGIGGKGNEGVAAYVKQIPNAIGYVEYAFVVQNDMPYAALQNAAGNWVSPSVESFSNAAESADWKDAKDFNLVMTNAPGANSYPLTATTFILMPKEPADKARSDAALAFFRYALTKAQKAAQNLDYVPLPASLAKQIDAYLSASIK